MAYFAILVRGYSKSYIYIFYHWNKLYFEIQKRNQSLNCTLLSLFLTFLGGGSLTRFWSKAMKHFIIILSVLQLEKPKHLSIYHSNSELNIFNDFWTKAGSSSHSGHFEASLWHMNAFAYLMRLLQIRECSWEW